MGDFARMATSPRLLADWQNADEAGRVRLNTRGALRQIERLGATVATGLKVILDDDDEFEADGTVEWSSTEHIWVAQHGPLRERSGS
jgi:hypothetical protein